MTTSGLVCSDMRAVYQGASEIEKIRITATSLVAGWPANHDASNGSRTTIE